MKERSLGGPGSEQACSILPVTRKPGDLRNQLGNLILCVHAWELAHLTPELVAYAVGPWCAHCKQLSTDPNARCVKDCAGRRGCTHFAALRDCVLAARDEELLTVAVRWVEGAAASDRQGGSKDDIWQRCLSIVKERLDIKCPLLHILPGAVALQKLRAGFESGFDYVAGGRGARVGKGWMVPHSAFTKDLVDRVGVVDAAPPRIEKAQYLRVPAVRRLLLAQNASPIFQKKNTQLNESVLTKVCSMLCSPKALARRIYYKTWLQGDARKVAYALEKP